MISLLLYVTALLEKKADRVYQEIAPEKDPITNKKPEFPYVVYNFPPSSSPVPDRDDKILEIDVWDNIPDTTRLEQLTDSIDKSLNKLRHLEGDFFVIFQRLSKGSIPDPDPKIRRRQIRYLLKTYDRRLDNDI
ncbi:hypothetical protein BHU72_12010 [Desulfuribacillus stibiiarsenatis]|uniref:DUF3168 domain-containing protein n=1 Tax=Desulfuribacillus stibiiarsenatis TaxID=1390249 RepID=A0A1E5L7W9_9FIRM|nr:hypothetical protein [Desulfuribacillus stibiiarsenatis]OEH86252.1 hypothetical protein BHU72_12010 [Desulfuribacillus stibiiarsenatis]